MLKINRSSFAVSFVFLLIPFGRKPQKLQKPRWCVAFSFFWSLSQFHNMLAVPFSTFYLRMFLVEFFADNFRCIFLQFRFTHAPTHALGHNTRISWIFSVACCSLLIAFCPLLFALRSPLHVVVSHLVRNERLCQSPETVWPFILYGPADFPAHRDKPKNGKGNVRRERRRKENRERRLLPIKCSTFSVSGKSRAQMREFYSQTSAEAAAPLRRPPFVAAPLCERNGNTHGAQESDVVPAPLPCRCRCQRWRLLLLPASSSSPTCTCTHTDGKCICWYSGNSGWWTKINNFYLCFLWKQQVEKLICTYVSNRYFLSYRMIKKKITDTRI